MKSLKTCFNGWTFSVYYIKDVVEAQVAVCKLMDGPNILGLDVETSKEEAFREHPKAGLCPLMSQIRLMQLYDGSGTVYIFDLNSIPLALLKPVLTTKSFVAHNGLFEIKHLTHNGYPDLKVGCSMLMSQLVHTAEHSPYEPEDPDEEEEEDVPKYKRSSHSLAALTYRLFKIRVSKEHQIADWGAAELTNDQLLYAGLDAVLTYKCAKELVPKIREYKMEQVYQLLKDMQHVVAEMELEGFPVDWEAHEDLLAFWFKRLEECKVKCAPFFGETNVKSSKQMGQWFEGYLLKQHPSLFFKWPKTEKGSWSFTRTKIFPFRGIPAVDALLEFKKYAKLVDAFGDNFRKHKHPVTKRVHTSFTLGQTRTGRMSARDPNLQQIPADKKGMERSFREVFKTDKAFVVADFGQIELRIQAELSKDPVMRKVFSNGEDIYVAMASALTGKAAVNITKDERQMGKVVMLSLGYGMGPTKLRDYAAMGYDINLTEEQSEKYHQTYHNTFKVYSSWCNRIRDHATKLGYARTVLGKMRKLEEKEIYTKGPNLVVQGTAFEVMGLTCLKAKTKLKGKAKLISTIHKAKLISTIHDELIAECNSTDTGEVSAIIKESMVESMLQLFPEASTIGLAEPHAGVTWKEAKA